MKSYDYVCTSIMILFLFIANTINYYRIIDVKNELNVHTHTVKEESKEFINKDQYIIYESHGSLK